MGNRMMKQSITVAIATFLAIAGTLTENSAWGQAPRSTEPNLDELAMTCTGTIHNRIDFTITYARESGFNRAEFRPRTSKRVFYTDLAYIGQNRLGRGVWHDRGEGNTDASVALVHLSQRAAQRGDLVSVAYDGQWGRGTCR